MDKNIIWLASWYPSLLAPYDGDFIQRHAKACSILKKITVIHIKKDKNAIITKDVKEIVSIENNLTEIIVYYHSLKTNFFLLDKIFSAIKYKNVYQSILNKYIKTNGLPALVHLHVALKAGVQAIWLKKKHGIPFILSEHWSGFFKENKAGVTILNYLDKKLIKTILANAIKITVVSNELGKQINQFYKLHSYHVIPNTVNTSIFNLTETTLNNIPFFIHISSLNYEKNVEDIIEAFHLVKQKGVSFNFIIYGPPKKHLHNLVSSKNLDDCIFFKPEVSQSKLAFDVKRADALILYSRYETFGCVVIEANACGVPAILSDIPAFREYSIENKTAVFAKPNNPEDLANSILIFLNNRTAFSKHFIATYIKQNFSYEVIGNKFYEMYKSIIE